MKKFFNTLKSAVQDFIEDECMVSGAALAYYTIFSLPPLLVVVFFIAGTFNVSEERINEVVSRQIGVPIPQASGSDEPAGSDGAKTRESAKDDSGSMQAVAQRKSSASTPLKQLGPLSKVIGALILVFSATGVFAQLQHALNRAWEVEPAPDTSGWKNYLAKRGLSLGMIVVIAFLLLVSLVLSMVVDEIVHLVLGQDPGGVGTAIGILVNNLIALSMATLLFAAMYKTLPDADMRWKDMWVGAFITAVLFVVGKTLIGWYLQNSQIGSAWGSAAASIIALLVWVYYTSVIVLLGAELTQAWAKNYGHGIVPEDGAVRVVQRKQRVPESREQGAAASH